MVFVGARTWRPAEDMRDAQTFAQAGVTWTPTYEKKGAVFMGQRLFLAIPP